MLFQDARHNNPQIIHNKLKFLRTRDGDKVICDFSDEAYANAEEMYEILKPMTAVGHKKIRLGAKNDGGYIFLDAFSEEGIAYSFGIASYDPFSLDMLERGYDVWQYDGTIDISPYNHPRVHFNRFNISGDENPQQNERDLRQIIKENGHQGATKIILQCDIEGYEWSMLETAQTEDIKKFAQISLEIHCLRATGGEWQRQARILRKLNETHQLIHIHANNYGGGTVLKNFRYLPDTFEVSYARKDFCQFVECEEEFPTTLDAPCDPSQPDIFIGNFNPMNTSSLEEDLRANQWALTLTYTFTISHSLESNLAREFKKEMESIRSLMTAISQSPESNLVRELKKEMEDIRSLMTTISQSPKNIHLLTTPTWPRWLRSHSIKKTLVQLLCNFIPPKQLRRKVRNAMMARVAGEDSMDQREKFIKPEPQLELCGKLDELCKIHLRKQEEYHVELCKKMELQRNGDVYELPSRIKFYVPFYPWDAGANSIVNGRDFHERAFLERLKKYIPANAVVLDIGANIGNYAIFMAINANAGKVHAFEPVPQTYDILTKNITLNGLEEIIIPHNIGLGDKDSFGEVAYAHPRDIGTTSIRESGIANKFSLKIQALDNIALGEERIDFVKIDVENFELQALTGMKNTLKKYRPVVYIESFEEGHGYSFPEGFSSNAPKVKEFFKKLGGYADGTTTDYINWLFIPAN
ncbi:MAG: FkbM family methyltransferase [Synergistaceae bacterium]|jgi:FkbM family methyltransferase|nr:FkbM family methyltransferase [Synergistaceae bacterium]